MRLNRAVWGLPLLLVALVLVSGCNIFSFTHSASSSSDYVAEGNQNLWDGKYADAEESFANAIKEDSLNGDARWGHAKALLRSTGFTGITLLAQLSTMDPAQGGQLPFMDPTEWPAAKTDTLYQALKGIATDLGMFSHGVIPKDSNGNPISIPGGFVQRPGELAKSPELDSNAVALDMAGTLAIKGIVAMRDTNNDGVIDDSDFNLIAFFQTGGSLEMGLDAWNNMTQTQQEDMINGVVQQLQGSSAIILATFADAAPGVDTGALNETIGQVANQLYDPSTGSYWHP